MRIKCEVYLALQIVSYTDMYNPQMLIYCLSQK